MRRRAIALVSIVIFYACDGKQAETVESCGPAQKMKILMVVQEFPIMSETFVVTQAMGLLDRGHDVYLYSSNKQAPAVRNPDIDDYHLMDRVYYQQLPPDIDSFDVIIGQFGTCGIEALNTFKRNEKCRAKLITFFRGFDISSWAIANPHAYDDLFKEGDLFIVECDYFRKRLIALGADPARLLVHYLANPVKLARFAYTRRSVEADKPIQMITVSRLVEKKGLDDALRAMKRVMEFYPSLEYTIVGDGELREKLILLAGELNIAEHVHFVGDKTPYEVAEYLRDSDIFILPCLVAADGNVDAVPTALKEAMASGLPVVSTFVGGIPELVEEGKSGFLVQPHDVSALAEKMLYLIEHPEVRDSFGLVGHQIAHERCNFEKLSDEFEQILLALTSRVPDVNETFSVDFEEAMGKNDSYMHGYYEKLQGALKDPSHHFFRYVRPYNPLDLIELCKQVYAEHKPLIGQQSAVRIPRIFHQIWVGKKPFPEKYKKWQQAWQSVSGWEYKLWTDEDVEKMDFPMKDIYLKEKNMGARADMLRIEILYRYGGVYVDTDFELLKPDLFEVLHGSYDFYAALNPLDRESLVVNNAVMGSIPHHPLLKAYRENLQEKPAGKDNFAEIVQRGPGLLTKMILLHANRGHRDIVFPATFFYPLGVEQMLLEPYASMQDTVEKLERLKRDTVKPETAAIHWWEGSWKLPDSWENI